MRKLVLTTGWVAIGLLPSMLLVGCANRHVANASDKPAAIAVDARVSPPAELLRCPQPVEGFPVDQMATMPPEVRNATIRVARALSDNFAQLERLIGWESGKPCR